MNDPRVGSDDDETGRTGTRLPVAVRNREVLS